MDSTPLLPPHMLPVPAKSSKTRAILLLISAHTEHLWIPVKNVFVKAKKTAKMSLASDCFPSPAPIARRQREPAHLRHRLPAQPENTRRLPTALPLIEHELPNRRVDLHREHPRQPQKGSA